MADESPLLATPAGNEPPAGDGKFQKFIGNIAQMESGGRYDAVGVNIGNGDRALGKYQVMASNVPSWSKEVLGESITPEEFLKSPQLQEKIAQTKLAGYVEKHGYEGAAQAWLGGEGSIGKLHLRDANGTTIGKYGRRAVEGLDGEASSDRLKHLTDAKQSLDLTPEEEDLYHHHLNELYGSGGYLHKDGSRSTLFAMDQKMEDGKTYMMPKVYDGRIVPDQEAEDRAREKGLNKFPSYGSAKEAQDRYGLLHGFMEQDTNDKERAEQQQQVTPLARDDSPPPLLGR